MSQNRYTQGICSIWVDAADIFAVQHDGVVAQKISVMADVFQFDSPLRDNFFWVPGLIAANYSIGSIDYACVQGLTPFLRSKFLRISFCIEEKYFHVG